MPGVVAKNRLSSFWMSLCFFCTASTFDLEQKSFATTSLNDLQQDIEVPWDNRASHNHISDLSFP